MKKTRLAIIFTSLILVMSIAGSLLFVNNINGAIRLFKTAITINFKDNVYTYNDQELESLNYTISDGNLFNGDKLKFTFKSKIKNAGTYNRDKFEYQIVSQTGKDVTSSYIINENFENIVINKRPITIKTASAVGTYKQYMEGKVIYQSASIYEGSLCDNHTITAKGFRTTFYVGTFDNTCNVVIKDGSNNTVTSNYDITFYNGTLFVIQTQSQEDSKDGDDGDSYNYVDRDDESKDGSEDGSGSTNELDKDKEPSNPIYQTKEEVYKEIFKHMFFYYKKTSGVQFLRTNISGGTYDKNKSTKAIAYKNKYGLNPDEFVTYLLKDKVKHAEGTMDYSEFASRNYDVSLTYPIFNKEQDNDLYPILSDLKCDSLDLEGLYYDYMENPSLLDNIKVTDQTFIKAEKEYREFVYQNYLGVDETTLAFLKQYIKEKNLDDNSIFRIANKLINLFKNEFVYQMWELECYNSEYPMISFLRDTKTGSCTEFSCTATIIFRALGYPARQIGGYGISGTGKIDVTGLNAHAKMQVYFDGKGWVDFEFTVATPVDGTPNLPFKGDGADDSEEEKAEISISSESLTKTYDGTPLTSTSYTIEGDDKLRKGHKIYAYCNNSIINAGSIKNTVDYFILDSNFNDVSDQYNVTTNFGTLSVEKKQLQASTDDMTVNFNRQNENRSITISGGLVDGDSFSNLETVTFKSRGTYKNIIIITKIINKYGDDVTNNYEITYTYGTLEVI